MAQYIHVYMDDEKNNYKNKGLYEIIVFIGEKSYRGKKDVTIEEAYKRGKKIINSKLNKWHLSTIERLLTNLDSKLKEHKFDIKLFWSKQPDKPYQKIVNQSD